MERSKRVINKPSRFGTTASEEEPPAKRTRILLGSIAEDIEVLRRTLEGPHFTPLTNNYTPRTNIYTPPTDNYTPPTNTYIPPTNTYTPPTYSYTPQSKTYRPQAANTQTIYVSGSPVDAHQMQQESTGTIQMRAVHQKIDRLEAMMMKIIAILESMQQQQQQFMLQQRGSIPSKPAGLPITSEQEMTDFENLDDPGYKAAVSYLQYQGGSNIKKAVALCFKEVFSDCVLANYSWLGREENNLPLRETRAVRVIHDSMFHNHRFARPTRKEIEEGIKTALRRAKKRLRSRRIRARNPQPLTAGATFWDGEEEQAWMQL